MGAGREPGNTNPTGGGGRIRLASPTTIDTAHIDPGKPWQNGVDESFNRKLRDECLNVEWFRHRHEATVLIEQWRRHSNEVRPHSSLRRSGGACA